MMLDFLEEYRTLSEAEMQVRELCQTCLQQHIRATTAYWKQRGKQKAIREGDANTAFHHAQATQRLRRNHIGKITHREQELFSHESKIAAVTDYFSGIMGEAGNSTWKFNIDELYNGRQLASESLTAPFTDREALQAIRSMNKLSAPGPDGFGPIFYSCAWTTVKTQVMDLLNAFQQGEAELERINRAYMVLLPKKPGCTTVDSFRPINLQNCSVKIITKIMTTRLQQDICSLIDLDQTGFIQGRSITENFVYAMELIQCCHKRKTPALVIKLDFAKAFDTVNWDGLLTVLRARGFNQKWQRWILQLLASSKTSVLLNGVPGPWFACKRGLRQGDPLSLYLFLLVADVLQSLIKHSRGVRHPLIDDRPCPVLQYADDTLILLRADLEDVKTLKKNLDDFSDATGLKINFSKSAAVPMNIDEQHLPLMIATLGCRLEGFPQTYLGLPLSPHKLRLSSFAPHIAKADKYLAGWQAALLNPMGRAVLINSVLDSQLIYIMSAVLVPNGVVAHIDRRRRSFLWNGNDECLGASCLVAWDTVCTPKEDGGLGIKDLKLHNICLLIKLIHRLHSATDSSWAVWVKEHMNMATMEGDLGGPHWDSLRTLLPIYQAVSTSTVGDGCSTNFWHDAWHGEDDLATKLPALFSHCVKQQASVADVMANGLHLVTRLSSQAQLELHQAQNIISGTQLSQQPDERKCMLTSTHGKLQTSALYEL